MLVYEEETGKILKACMNVFNELGNGFLEAVYQEALAIVELKCVSKLVNANKAQVINYLHGTHFAVGLLVNFGESSLKWERLTLLKNKEKITNGFARI